MSRLLGAALAGVACWGIAAGAVAAAVARADPLSRVVAAESSANPHPPTMGSCERRLHLRCYRPSQLDNAYRLRPLFRRGIDGKRRTIVVLESFGSPTIVSDLRSFDRAFGLPAPPSLRVYHPVGAVPPPRHRLAGDRLAWAFETTLDVEWAHVFAPGANLVVLETPVDETTGLHGMPQMMSAVRWAVAHHIGDVISMSFGATEQTFPSKSSIFKLRSAFVTATQHHVALVSASGDTGATGFTRNNSDLYPYRTTPWPGSDPLVLCAGGTKLTLDKDGRRQSPDVVWSDPFGAGGGGRSSVFRRPAYQGRVRSVVGGRRGLPDISLGASDAGASDVFVSFLGRPGWAMLAGTSLATAELAGLLADTAQLAGHSIGDAPAHVYSLLARRGSGIVDVTRGNNTFRARPTRGRRLPVVRGFSATPGYDLASGLGTVDAASFVPALAGT